MTSYLGALPKELTALVNLPRAVLCAFPTSSHGDPEKDAALDQRGVGRETSDGLPGSARDGTMPLGAGSFPRNGSHHSNTTKGALLGLRRCPHHRYIPGLLGLGWGCTPGSPETQGPPPQLPLAQSNSPSATHARFQHTASSGPQTANAPWDLVILEELVLKGSEQPLTSARLFQGGVTAGSSLGLGLGPAPPPAAHLSSSASLSRPLHLSS